MTELEREPIDWMSALLAPAAAALATISATSALTGVIRGWSWLTYTLVAVVLISCTGLAMRSLRMPPIAVGLGQLAVLSLLVTGMFTEHGIFAIIPGPAAISELGDVLALAGEQIKTGLPPVDATAPILCLVTIGIGMVAVLVDTLAVAAAAPAASGLVLLCLYAVPASLADEMLPWWTFSLGAAAFAALMAVDGNHRHRAWRGRGSAIGRSPEAAAAPSTVVLIALMLGLFVGSAFTAIGTVGQLPGAGPGESRSFSGGLGIHPFTSLRGLLTDRGTTEVFRVRGLGDERRLLRAFTLDTYVTTESWQLSPGPMRAGEAADGKLSKAPGDTGGSGRRVRIEPLNWNDHWLPIYGSPRDIDGVDDTWYYDVISGTVYSERKQRPPAYTVITRLAQPTEKQLAEAEPDGRVPSVYTAIHGIDDRVERLTHQLTSGASSTFGKAKAIWRHLTTTGGFTYDTKTAARSDNNALADFLLKGKRGYCEQFASSMAVMLRVEGIPARVAVGFTAGTASEQFQVITTRDAHAWVEVYFGEKYGWVPFDPTPLDGGRGSTQPYLEVDNQPGSETDPSGEEVTDPRSAPQPEQPGGVEPDAANATDESTSLAQAPGWVRWSTLPIALIAALLTAASVLVARRAAEVRGRPEPSEDAEKLSTARQWLPIAMAAAWLLCIVLIGWMVSWWLALVLLIVVGALATPAMLRDVLRGRRLHAVTMREHTAADAAWHELLDECADRAAPVGASSTVRDTARQVAIDQRLDDAGKQHLRTVVAVLERSWYGEEQAVDQEFSAAFEGLRKSLNRTAPLSVRDRMLPASVVNRYLSSKRSRKRSSMR